MATHVNRLHHLKFTFTFKEIVMTREHYYIRKETRTKEPRPHWLVSAGWLFILIMAMVVLAVIILPMVTL
jgi:hypothetical protein